MFVSVTHIAKQLTAEAYEPSLIALTGVTGAGKSTVCEAILKADPMSFEYLDAQNLEPARYAELAEKIASSDKITVIDGLIIEAEEADAVLNVCRDRLKNESLSAIVTTQYVPADYPISRRRIFTSSYRIERDPDSRNGMAYFASESFQDTARAYDSGQYRETAGRMYEASDILQAIKTGRFTSLEELTKAVEQRCEHLSNELIGNK